MTKENFLYQSLRIRMIEEAIASKYSEQKMRCPVHLSIGQEANAVAIAGCLTNEDYMVSTHRGHAHYLAKGGSLVGLLGELYGKSVGCSGGSGGSMHLTDRSCGFLASTSIVGGTIPIGVGAAFSAVLKKEKKVAVVCIGDAALEEGVFHECANFSSLHSLPVIFYVENNYYSCYTHIDKRQPQRSDESNRVFQKIAAAHSLKYHHIDKYKYYDGVQTLWERIDRMRESKKHGFPILVEVDTYRHIEHCGPNNDDNLNYRPTPEIEHAKLMDPITMLKGELRDSFDWEYARSKIKKEIEEAFEIVENSPPPDYSAGEFLYA